MNCAAFVSQSFADRPDPLQAEVPQMNPNAHEGMTHMLFVDAIVGVGFPVIQVAIAAERGGLASRRIGGRHDGEWYWNRRILGTLSLATLQDLYTGLKLHEVTHAG